MSFNIRGYNLFLLSQHQQINRFYLESSYTNNIALAPSRDTIRSNSIYVSKDPRNDLESISDRHKYYDLWESETGIKVILYYKGRSNQEWIYEGSYIDYYDIGTYEQIEHELAKMNHFGLQDYDRFETTATGGFSFSMINDVINLADVQIIAMIAQIRNIDDMERQWYGDDSWDVKVDDWDE